MKLTVLGSGTNIHPTRAAAGYLVKTDRSILLDFGPRTLSNLLKTGVDRHSITHILFSHFHADHFSDFITFFFDALIYTKHGGGRRPDLTLIGPRGAMRVIRGDVFRLGVQLRETLIKVRQQRLGHRGRRSGTEGGLRPGSWRRTDRER